MEERTKFHYIGIENLKADERSVYRTIGGKRMSYEDLKPFDAFITWDGNIKYAIPVSPENLDHGIILYGASPEEFSKIENQDEFLRDYNLEKSKAEHKKDDMVNHPPNHYADKQIEVIDYIRDTLTEAGFTDYCNGNVLKYVSRWRKKGGVEDLRKAQVYLGWAIESAERESCTKECGK